MAKKSNKFFNYFKEVKSELKKVVWPSFKQVKNNTLIVIICVLLIGAFIWVLDFGLTKGWTIINPPAETTEQATDSQAQGGEVSEDELNAMLEQYGIGYDAETEKYTDLETNEELTQEQLAERLNAAREENGAE